MKRPNAGPAAAAGVVAKICERQECKLFVFGHLDFPDLLGDLKAHLIRLTPRLAGVRDEPDLLASHLSFFEGLDVLQPISDRRSAFDEGQINLEGLPPAFQSPSGELQPVRDFLLGKMCNP